MLDDLPLEDLIRLAGMVYLPEAERRGATNWSACC